MNSFIKIKTAYNLDNFREGRFDERIININQILYIDKVTDCYMITFNTRDYERRYVSEEEMRKVFNKIGVSL